MSGDGRGEARAAAADGHAGAATLAAALEAACRRFAERPALSDGGAVTTYAELGRASAALAGAYRRLGMGRGDRVVCRLPNGAAHVVATVAAWRAGAGHVAADHDLTARETAQLADMTGARALLHAGDGAAAAELRRLLPGTVLLDADALAALAGEGAPAPEDGPNPGDVAAIFTTSGSTGTPKLPVGLHGKLHASWTRLSGGLGFGPDDVHLVQLPLAHGFGLMLATAGLLGGGRLVLLDRFSADAALGAIERERVTVFNGTPAHFELVLDRLRREPADAGSLRIGVAAGAAFGLPLLQAIYAELRMDLMLMYGSSEGVGVATRDRDDVLAGSVGRPEPEGSVAILDADGRALPAGETGEIAFARAFNPVRYWGEPEEAARERAQGWYRSGDLGRFDEAGRLHVVGRIKHQVNRGGLKVDPAEVELALRECAGVADAAVIGVPSPVLGEVVCACVVPAAGEAPSLGELRAQLAGGLAPFKLPDELCTLDAIPRTAFGKVDHRRLRELVLGGERESVRAAAGRAG